MWDWASFASGVVGAILGAGLTLITTFLARRDAKTKTLQDAIDDVNASFGELIKPDKFSSAMAISQTHLAITRFERHVRRSDSAMIAWLVSMLGVVATADTVPQRTGAVGIIAINLGKWEKGEVSAAWFESDAIRLERL